jgi:hypothetical protein
MSEELERNLQRIIDHIYNNARIEAAPYEQKLFEIYSYKPSNSAYLITHEDGEIKMRPVVMSQSQQHGDAKTSTET